jgi:hypothetical protein
LLMLPLLELRGVCNVWGRFLATSWYLHEQRQSRIS